LREEIARARTAIAMHTSMTIWHRRGLALRYHAREFGLQVLKFANRYGLAIGALVFSALLGWWVANSVSDYTNHGWELHIRQPNLGVDIHFHHWYYGIPLGLIALLLIPRQATLSIFLFGLGASLSTHSFVNEGGIPSLMEGGPTWRIPIEIYLPFVTLFSALYAFFIVRREEWLVRSREREEIAMTYMTPNDHMQAALATLDEWGKAHFNKKRMYFDRWTHIEYGYFRALDREHHGEWQMHYTAAPFDDISHLLVIKLQHIPMIGRKGTLDEWLEEINALLKPHAHVVLQEDRVIEADHLEVADAPNA
jgi:hypothetical protein